MKALSAQFFQKLVTTFQEEETDIYVLNLYYRNSEDLLYFNKNERRKVKRIFDILIKDTKRHMELLKLVIDLGSK